MNDLQFSGIISHISPVETFVAKTGQEKQSREVVITTDEQYPKSLAVRLKRDSLLTLPLSEGQRVTAHLSPKVRTSAEGRIFNEIEAWRIDF